MFLNNNVFTIETSYGILPQIGQPIYPKVWGKMPESIPLLTIFIAHFHIIYNGENHTNMLQNLLTQTS